METSILKLLKAKDSLNIDISQRVTLVGQRNQQAVKSSIDAIFQVLSRKQYKVNCKLASIRYLKECFIQGNREFIEAVEIEILPLLRKIVQDKYNHQSYSYYAVRNYETEEEVKQFKSELMTLFQLVQQCLINWANWLQNYKYGSNQFINMITKLSRLNLLKQTKSIYFKASDKSIFLYNLQHPKKNKGNSSKIQNILKRVDNLVELPKQQCGKQIVRLTNQLEDISKNLKQNDKKSFEKEFQTRLARASTRMSIKNDKAIDNVKQMQSVMELTVVSQSSQNTGQFVQLQYQSFVNPVKNNNKQHSQLSTNIKSEQVSSILNPKKTHRKTSISSWNQKLQYHLSQQNLLNFKFSLLKESKIIFQNKDLKITYSLQNCYDENYKIKLNYQLSTINSSFRWKPQVSNGIIANAPVKVSSLEYKQIISVKYSHFSRLINWVCFINNNEINFPLPLSVLNILLKGLLSKDRTCSQFKCQCVSSKIITLNPKILKESSQIKKYFNTGTQGKSSNGRDSWISCLLHETTDTLMLLQIQFCGERQVRFQVDLIDPNQQQLAHILVQTLVFIFEQKI